MSNISSEQSELAHSVPATAAIGFFAALAIILTIIGNFIVMLSFVFEKKLRNFSDYLILNLAIADFLIGSVAIPFYVPYLLTGRWPFGHDFCIIWLIIDYITPAASAINIFVVSLDRYIQVGHPLWSRNNQTPSFLALLIAIPWVIPALYFVPVIGLWEVIHGPVIPEYHCYIPYKDNIIALLIGAVIEFVFPFVTVTLFNILVYANIKKRSQRFWKLQGGGTRLQNVKPAEEVQKPEEDVATIDVGSSSNSVDAGTSSNDRGTNAAQSNNTKSKPHHHRTASNAAKASFNKDRRAARSLFIFVIVFAVCWMPYEIIATIQTICGGCVDPVLFEFAFWILWINSTINPILYPLLHTRYRKAFMKLLNIKLSRVTPAA